MTEVLVLQNHNGGFSLFEMRFLASEKKSRCFPNLGILDLAGLRDSQLA